MSSADPLFAVFDDSSDADDAPAPEEVPQSTAASSVLQMVETATAGAGWLPEALAEQLGPHPPSLTALRGVNRFWRQAVSSASAVWARCCAQDWQPSQVTPAAAAADASKYLGPECRRRVEALLAVGDGFQAFYAARKDAGRRTIALDELCSLRWWFRFKRAAGGDWCSTRAARRSLGGCARSPPWPHTAPRMSHAAELRIHCSLCQGLYREVQEATPYLDLSMVSRISIRISSIGDCVLLH